MKIKMVNYVKKKMGEISDDILNGLCCALCGCYFVEKGTSIIFEHGYPVVCRRCYDDNCSYPRQDPKAETL